MPRLLTITLICAVLTALAPLNAAAGDLGDEVVPATGKTTHPAHAILFGLGAGAVGFAAGALIGARSVDSEGELDDLKAAFIGGSVLGSLTLPLGVHVGNRRQGKLGLVMATSVAAGLAGWGVAFGANDAHLLLLTPALQLVACVVVETATTPSDGRAPPQSDPPRRPLRWRVDVAPVVGPRRVGLVVSGNF